MGVVLTNRTSSHPGLSLMRTGGTGSGLSAFLRNPGSVKCTLLPQGEDRAQDVPSVLHVYKQLPRSPRTVAAILEGAGLRDLLENMKCQAGVQTVFKCFKMQITTGFKFPFPPLLKTKVKAGLPKSHRAAVCISGAWPGQRQL